MFGAQFARRLAKQSTNFCVPSIGSLSQRVMGFSTTYYDSQSGLHIAFSDEIKVHAFAQSLPLPAGVSGLASITLPNGQTSVEQIESEKTPTFIPTRSDADIKSAQALGAQCSVVLDCSSARKSRDDILAICSSGHAAGMQLKATLQDSLDVDPSKLVLAAELLADSGVETIVLEVESDFDEDDLAEAVEALAGSDVAGLPMKQRIGICILPESPESGLAAAVGFAASNLGVKHIVADFAGSLAPRPQEIKHVLSKADLPHSLKLA